MGDLVVLFGNILLIILLMVAAVVVVSLPFAFTGWIILLAVNIFTPVPVTYFGATILGLCVSIIGVIIK